MSMKCDVCGAAALTHVLKDPFGKSDQMGSFCAVHAPGFSALRALPPETESNPKRGSPPFPEAEAAGGGVAFPDVRTSKERSDFEKWATEQGWEIGIRYPDAHPTYGRYEEGAIQYMWAAWRTRAERASSETLSPPAPDVLKAAKELCDAAINYAGDVGLSRDAWLWDKIHAFESACCPVASMKASEHRCTCGLFTLPAGIARTSVGTSMHRLDGPCHQVELAKANSATEVKP